MNAIPQVSLMSLIFAKYVNSDNLYDDLTALSNQSISLTSIWLHRTIMLPY